MTKNYKEQLEGGYRFLRIRRTKRLVLGVQAIIVIILSVFLMILAGFSLTPFYVPVSAFLLIALAFLLIMSGQNFAFRSLELKASRRDSQRYLIARNSMANSAWVIGLAAVALVVLLALTQAGWAHNAMSRSGTRDLAPGNTFIVVMDNQDTFGLARVTSIEVTANGPLVVNVGDANGPERFLTFSLPSGGTQRYPVRSDLDAPFYRTLNISFETPALAASATNFQYRVNVDPIADLSLWIPLLLVGFIAANAAWIAYLAPLRKKYQSSSIYSLEYREEVATGEETYLQYSARTGAGATPAMSQIRPGVYATDRPCPTCGQPLVFVQKFRRHYCLNCKKYPPAAAAPAAPKPAIQNPCPTCGAEMKWMERYSRFYCISCRNYAPRDYAAPMPAAPAPPAPAPPPPTPAPAPTPEVRPVAAPMAEKVPEPAAEILVREASEAYRAGDYPRAIELLDSALELDPGHLTALLSRGAALMKIGRRLDALPTFERVLQIDERNEKALQIRALLLEGEQQWAEALQAHEAYLAVKPSDVEFQVKKGEALLALGRRDDAIAQFEKALVVAPRDARIRSRLDDLRFDIAAALSRALLASAGGNYSQAVRLFDQVLLREPTNVNALMGKAVALRRSGHLEEAMACVRQLLAASPGHPAALLNLGRILEEQGKEQDALGAYQELLQSNPQDGEAWERQGDLLRRSDHAVEALFSYKQAREARGPDAALDEKIRALERVVPPVEAAPPAEPAAASPVPVEVTPEEKPAEPAASIPEAPPAAEVPPEVPAAEPGKGPEEAPVAEKPPTLVEPSKAEPVPRPEEPIPLPAGPVPLPAPAEEVERPTAPEPAAAEPVPEPEKAPETPPVRTPEVPPQGQGILPLAVEEERAPEELPPEEKLVEEVPTPPEPVAAPIPPVPAEPEPLAATEPAPEPAPEPEPEGGEAEPEEAPAATPAADLDAAKAELAKIKGLGPARIRALVKAGYTSVDRLKAASEDDLAGVKGMSKTVAKAIRRHFAS